MKPYKFKLLMEDSRVVKVRLYFENDKDDNRFQWKYVDLTIDKHKLKDVE